MSDDASKLNIHQRLHAVMQEVDYIQKDCQAPPGAGGYKYPSHDAVVAGVRPALVKHGILAVSDVAEHVVDGNRTTITLRVCFVNIDNPDDCVTTSFVGHGISKQDKGPGIATTYAFKTALLKTLVLETGEDPEGQTVNHVPGAACAAENGAPTQEPGDNGGFLMQTFRKKAAGCVKHMGLAQQLLVEAIKAKHGKETLCELTDGQASDIVEELKLRAGRFDEVDFIFSGREAGLYNQAPKVTAWLIEKAKVNHNSNPLLAPLSAWRGWMEELRQREPANV